MQLATFMRSRLGVTAVILAMTSLALFGVIQRTFANHATAPDEITVASAAAGTSVPVGNTFDVTMAVTTSTNAYKAIQWELAYGQNVSFVSATYSCPAWPSGTTVDPTEQQAADVGPSGLSGLKILGGGASCASLNAAYTGSNATGVFVTVTLQCTANGASPVFAVRSAAFDPQADEFFGTTLSDRFGSAIPTTLEDQGDFTPYGNQSGFNVTCGTTVVDTPTSTSTATATVPATSTATGTATFTSVPTDTATSTATLTAVATETPTSTSTATTEVATETPTSTSTATTEVATETPTSTSTATTEVATETPTSTSTATTEVATETPTSTSTATTEVATETPTSTSTATTEVATETPTGTGTSSPTPINTSTPTSTPTITPTMTGTPTSTSTSIPTSTSTSTSTPTITPTMTGTATATATSVAGSVTAVPSATRTATRTAVPTMTPTTVPGDCLTLGERIGLIVGILVRFGAHEGHRRYSHRYDINDDGVINFEDLRLVLEAPACPRRGRH